MVRYNHKRSDVCNKLYSMLYSRNSQDLAMDQSELKGFNLINLGVGIVLIIIATKRKMNSSDSVAGIIILKLFLRGILLIVDG